MTYRERREARAERLRGWADKRTERASATLRADDAMPYAHDIAFLTQPGHIPERGRMNARSGRAHASLAKADEMSARADNIERAADRAIYSDDPDIRERLTARIAELEALRDQHKAENAAYRKAHRAELAGMTPYGREQVVPHPSYSISGLTANIARNRSRLGALR